MDKRLEKTRKAIKKSFEEMIVELSPEEITVKGLTDRAKINRKTFYLHYNCIEELYAEEIRSLSDGFIEAAKEYVKANNTDMLDTENIIRIFFDYFTGAGEFAEKLVCSPDYHGISNSFLLDLLMYCEPYNIFGDIPKSEQRIVLSFISASLNGMFRTWVADGKQIPLSRMADICATMVASGLRGCVATAAVFS